MFSAYGYALQLFEWRTVFMEDVLYLAVIFCNANVDDLLRVWQFLYKV